MITIPAAKRAIARMSDLKFFPADPDLRAVIMEELADLCEDDSQVDWLARRMSDLCREWPRIIGLRQVYFSKFPPRNERQRKVERLSESTEAFPEGVPSEVSEARQLSASNPRLLRAPVYPLANQILAEVVGAVPSLDELAAEVAMHAAAARPRTSVTAEDVESARQQELERRKRAGAA